MSKLTIIGAIVLMSISLLGMVGLQLYWISDAIQVKQEQFDRSVHEALARVVEKLETQEAVSAVTSGMATLQAAPVQVEVLEQTQPAPPPVAQAQAVSVKQEPKPASPITPIPAGTGIAVTAKSAKKDFGTGATWQERYTADGRNIPAERFFPVDSLMQRMLSPAVRMYNFPAEHAAMLKHLKVQADTIEARSIRLSGLDGERLRKLTENTITHTRQLNGRSFHISMDTLQYIALHLDSLRRYGYLNHTIDPASISAINVQTDSVFIFKKGKRQRESVNEQRNQLGGRVIFRSVDRPQEKRMEVTKPSARFYVHATEMHGQAASAKVAGSRPKPEQAPKAQQTAVAPTQPDPVRVEARQERLNEVVEKMVVEYVANDKPLEQRLNLEEIKPLLQSELQDKGICLDFGYWVLSDEQDTLTAAYLPTNSTRNFATYKASLFPNDIFDKSDYLAVYFPDSQAYAIRSLWMMLAFSALFTLIMVATFGTTIHIIFRQKKLSDMKNDFINNMTHEFKTPIATISLAADAISNPKVYVRPEKVQYYTGIIRQENKRMNAQVENVLQIARLEKDDYEMNLIRTDLHALVLKAIESIHLQVADRQGTITTDLHATAPDLELDEVHFYNVICNLLDNANKYSPDRPTLHIRTYDTAGGILLAVEDKGMGMTRDAQLRVFDKFYRVPTGNLHNVKGFGLGLSYVKAIVKAHNGTIKLQSEPGKGSRFEVFLPASA
ncbi:HAMP domain-containing sensor histidine kinase [Pontibacter sp. BT731]|uniref:sensor histidine kinase n=1 Tax=Pontibacter coccineus TaxID=3063328 RepID=UPI0026E154A8|nr:HAMP domain-containing sensor histidine kinase [Pontibacter sp. BT731]MDO6388911.1 HAMP domain-containing sensor histidine kinase [Pontibacter sp. BT731]